MSYDLAVWHASRPITTQGAAEIYSRLGEENLADVDPHPGLKAFLEELTSGYPQIDDWAEDDLDNCPWTIAFDRSDAYIVMCMSFSRASEMAPIIEGLAAKHDLVCFNPQWPCILYPPRIAAMPHLRLSLENRTVVDDPTPNQISDAIASLNVDGNSFAILERTDSSYVQTGLQSTREFVIEFQDGSLDKHYQAVVRESERVRLLFLAYAEGHDRWKNEFDWKRLSFDP